MILNEMQRDLGYHYRIWLKRTRFKRLWWGLQRILRWLKDIPNYRILLYKKHDNKIEPVFSNGFVNSGARIGYDNQFFFLLDSNGVRFKNQVSCVIKDEVNKPTVAIVLLNVSSVERIDNREG